MEKIKKQVTEVFCSKSLLKSDQISLSDVVFLVASTSTEPHLSLISLRKNTSSKQDLQCKSRWEPVFLRGETRERRGRGNKVLITKNRKYYDAEFWLNFNYR